MSYPHNRTRPYDEQGHESFDGPTGVPGDPGWTHFCYTCGFHCMPAAVPDRCHYCGDAIAADDINGEAAVCVRCESYGRIQPVVCECCNCALTHAEECWERNWRPAWYLKREE